MNIYNVLLAIVFVANTIGVFGLIVAVPFDLDAARLLKVLYGATSILMLSHVTLLLTGIFGSWAVSPNMLGMYLAILILLPLALGFIVTRSDRSKLLLKDPSAFIVSCLTLLFFCSLFLGIMSTQVARISQITA